MACKVLCYLSPLFFWPLFFCHSFSFSRCFSNTGHTFWVTMQAHQTSKILFWMLPVPECSLSTCGPNSHFFKSLLKCTMVVWIIGHRSLLPDNSIILPYSCHGLMVVGLCFSSPQLKTAILFALAGMLVDISQAKAWNVLVSSVLPSCVPAFHCEKNMLSVATSLRRIRYIWNRSVPDL